MPELEAGFEDELPDDVLSLAGLDSAGFDSVAEGFVSDGVDESDPDFSALELLEDFDA